MNDIITPGGNHINTVNEIEDWKPLEVDEDTRWFFGVSWEIRTLAENMSPTSLPSSLLPTPVLLLSVAQLNKKKHLFFSSSRKQSEITSRHRANNI